MSNFNWPINPSTSGPIQFIKDGSAETVTQDTSIPANSVPLPVIPLDSSGNSIDLATETTLSEINAKLPSALGTNTASGSLSTVEASTTVSGTGSSLNAIILSSDVLGYKTVSVQITTNSSASNIASWEFSNDNSNWVSALGTNSVSGAGVPPSTSTNVTGIYIVPVQGRYFRLRVSTFSSGSISATAIITGSPEPLVNQFVVANQGSGNWSVRTQDGSGTSILTNIGSRLNALRVVDCTIGPQDQIDTTPLLDTSSTNIPASASSPLQVVASLAGHVSKIVSVEDIGEFIGVYTGGSGSETLLCVLPLGGGEIAVNIAIGTRISIRNMKNATISSGFIALNLIGPLV